MDSDDEDEAHARPGCCSSFWGPFRPLFGGHSLAEAATSSIVPTFVLLLYRTAVAIFLFATFLYWMVNARIDLVPYTSWGHLGLALSFSLTAAVSIIYVLAPPPNPTQSSTLAAITIMLFQVFATTVVFLDVVYWALLFDSSKGPPDFPNIVQHATNLAFVLFDMLLSLRMQFKLSYALLFIFYTLAYVVFVWIRYSVTNDFVYDFLDYRNKSPGRVVAYYVGVFVWGLVASIFVILLSRLRRLPCLPQLEVKPRDSPLRSRHDDDEDDDEDDHWHASNRI